MYPDALHSGAEFMMKFIFYNVDTVQLDFSPILALKMKIKSNFFFFFFNNLAIGSRSRFVLFHIFYSVYIE